MHGNITAVFLDATNTNFNVFFVKERTHRVIVIVFNFMELHATRIHGIGRYSYSKFTMYANRFIPCDASSLEFEQMCVKSTKINNEMTIERKVT